MHSELERQQHIWYYPRLLRPSHVPTFLAQNQRTSHRSPAYEAIPLLETCRHVLPHGFGLASFNDKTFLSLVRYMGPLTNPLGLPLPPFRVTTQQTVGLRSLHPLWERFRSYPRTDYAYLFLSSLHHLLPITLGIAMSSPAAQLFSGLEDLKRVSQACVVFTTVFLGLRIWTRARILRAFSLDDWFMIPCWVGTIERLRYKNMTDLKQLAGIGTMISALYLITIVDELFKSGHIDLDEINLV